jgi:predicted aspartyl protease
MPIHTWKMTNGCWFVTNRTVSEEETEAPIGAYDFIRSAHPNPILNDVVVAFGRHKSKWIKCAALVDTGANMTSIPIQIIEELKPTWHSSVWVLSPFSEKKVELQTFRLSLLHAQLGAVEVFAIPNTFGRILLGRDFLSGCTPVTGEILGPRRVANFNYVREKWSLRW